MLLRATPSLEAARLRLTQLAPGDAADLAAAMSDPGLYAYIGGAPPMVDEVAARIRRYNEGPPRRSEVWHNWALRLGPSEADAGRLIGHLQATVRGHDRDASVEIAWLVGTPWQGRGYASEAATVITDWLVRNGAREVIARIAPGHRASERVAANAGLRRTDETQDGEEIWRLVPGHGSRPEAKG